MKIINKMASKLGLRKRRYYTLMVRRDDYITVILLIRKYFTQLSSVYIFPILIGIPSRYRYNDSGYKKRATKSKKTCA